MFQSPAWFDVDGHVGHQGAAVMWRRTVDKDRDRGDGEDFGSSCLRSAFAPYRGKPPTFTS